MRLWGQSAHLLVTPSSDLCIEGYPRSANSFAVGAFKLTHPDALSIAHHTHVAANLIRACELGVPSVLLIRAPRAVVIARRAFRLQLYARSGQTHGSAPISLVDHLRSWLAFYRATRDYVNQCVVAPFPCVTTNFGAVVERVNDRFQQQFTVFEHTEANVQRIRKQKGFHALPDEQREEIKEKVRCDMEQLTAQPSMQHLVREAEELYDWYEQQASVVHQ